MTKLTKDPNHIPHTMHSIDLKRAVLTECVKTRINGHAPVIAISDHYDLPHSTVAMWHSALKRGDLDHLISPDEVEAIEVIGKSEWTQALTKTRAKSLSNMVLIHDRMGQALEDDGNERSVMQLSVALDKVTNVAHNVHSLPIGKQAVDVNVSGVVEHAVKIIELPTKKPVSIPVKAEVISEGLGPVEERD